MELRRGLVPIVPLSSMRTSSRRVRQWGGEMLSTVPGELCLTSFGVREGGGGGGGRGGGGGGVGRGGGVARGGGGRKKAIDVHRGL
ncbi:hypothetical protein GCM10020219_026900 [Nonomuraea dietziae]